MQELAKILNGTPPKTPLKLHSAQLYHFQRAINLFFRYLYCSGKTAKVTNNPSKKMLTSYFKNHSTLKGSYYKMLPLFLHKPNFKALKLQNFKSSFH